jgi:putative heme iron utilization protein
MEKERTARSLFLQESFGVLSTISIDAPGYPFGSVTPYAVDSQCRPIIYISHIAQHTKNLLKDPRVSLTVLEDHAKSSDVLTHGRVTCIADAHAVDANEEDVRERYFRYFPSAREFQATHDFSFFRLEPVRIRFIGGFGQIFWVERDEFMISNPFSAAHELRIIQHMNNDHADALRGYAGGNPAEMVGIDSEGFDLLNSGDKLRLWFDKPVQSMDDARQALISMARKTA